MKGRGYKSYDSDMLGFKAGQVYVHPVMGEQIRSFPVRYQIESETRKYRGWGIRTPDTLTLTVTDEKGIRKRVVLKQTQVMVIGWKCESSTPIKDESVSMEGLF